MRVFLGVAEHLSFAKCADALGMSRPTVTRTLAALEDSIGVPLLVRTTRRVALTPEGERYLDDCQLILEAVDQARATARGSHRHPTGVLRLTAPVLFGRLHVVPVLRAFLDAHAEVTADLSLLDRMSDLVEDGLDVAIRIGDLTDSSLRAVRVGEVHGVIVGSPAYLDRAGIPESPSDLANHTLIVQSMRRAWRLATGRVSVVPRVQTTDGASIVSLAEQGFGLCQLLSYQSGAGMAAGRLVPVLVAYQPPPVPVHLVFSGPRVPARTRAFVDHAVPALRARAANDWS